MSDCPTVRLSGWLAVSPSRPSTLAVNLFAYPAEPALHYYAADPLCPLSLFESIGTVLCSPASQRDGHNLAKTTESKLRITISNFRACNLPKPITCCRPKPKSCARFRRIRRISSANSNAACLNLADPFHFTPTRAFKRPTQLLAPV